VHPEIANAVKRAAVSAREIGWEADEFIPRGLERAHELWWLFFGRIFAPLTLAMISANDSASHWSGTEIMHRALAEPPVETTELLMAFAARDRMRAALLRQMDEAGITAILMPVCATAAFRHREREVSVGNGHTIDFLEGMKPVTPWNLLGMPGMVIPFAMTSDGLPIGVQVVGRPWDEESIIDIAVRLEQARGAFSSPPGY
jgi:Asp-tRNA(Asn)/Glu-tRNA(Gln) amidotransferase A subunit family amidase